MWLFDNLFLDQNTPVTINDGADHSKDVVQVVVDPDVSSWSSWSGWTGDGGSTPLVKKDDAFDTLFVDETEKSVEAILHPEAPSDIALEIGHAPIAMHRDTPSADPAVSFDIGWDISFDIGWDMTSLGGDTTTSTDFHESGVSFLDRGTDTLTWVVIGSAIEQVPTPIETSTDTALFSLLNEDTAPWSLWANASVSIDLSSQADATLETSQSNPWIDLSGVSISSSLLDLVSEPVSESVTEPIVDLVSEPRLSSELPTSFPVMPLVSDHENTSSVWLIPTTRESSLAMTTMTALSGAPKLKAKLSQFLSELEGMEMWDIHDKEHKKAQIDMYYTRISEIKAEYDLRIHAFQIEIAELEKDIAEMDREKSHIKTVIETFQKELETV